MVQEKEEQVGRAIQIHWNLERKSGLAVDPYYNRFFVGGPAGGWFAAWWSDIRRRRRSPFANGRVPYRILWYNNFGFGKVANLSLVQEAEEPQEARKKRKCIDIRLVMLSRISTKFPFLARPNNR